MRVGNFTNIIKYALCYAAAVLLAFAVYEATLVPVWASEAMTQEEIATQQTISDLQKQTQDVRNAIDSLQDVKEATENVVDSLQGQKAELKNTVEAYNDQLDDISDEIEKAESSMAEVSAEIVELDGQLQEAKEEEDSQYAALKNQIKSSYMSRGTDGLISMLFECRSFRELLNTTKYLESVVKYNKKKIGEFRQLQTQISEQKEEVEQRQQEIDEYQETLDNKYSELEDLNDKVLDDLAATDSSISNAKSQIANYDAQLASLDSKMKALEAQQAAAQAALAQQIAARLAASGQKEYTGGAYSASETELAWLAATIQAEADGESYTGKLAVGSVIMNRVKNSNFPGSITGVITQSNQFASYRSGKVNLIVNMGPNSTCMQAAREVLDGARVGDYLFFMTKPYADKYGIQNYTMIGNHAFFYSWNTGGGTPANTSAETQETSEEPEVIEDNGETYVEESQGE